ncbi:MAG: hypothetical protein FJ387_04910 [Verrucomicrobia bacterium]|nr:hypothetical protein [Verrucomicrobiota bacterium]
MTVEELAAAVLDACDTEGVDHLITGAFAVSAFGIPRATKDVDILLSVTTGDPIARVVRRLEPIVEFDRQAQFDTLTWSKRLVGTARGSPPFKVELFELFSDPFVLSLFSRRRKAFSDQLGRTTWLPTPEDVIVQKLRWGRNKDLDDARDVLAVQGPETLDMACIEKWCTQHGTTDRLRAALASIPPM